LHIKELNYDAGRKAETFCPDDIEMQDLPFARLGSFSLVVRQRYRYCHKLFDQLVVLHTQVIDQEELDISDSPVAGQMVGKPSRRHEYSFLSESLVLQMRRSIDTLIQYAVLIDIVPEDVPGSKLTESGLDDLLKCGGSEKEVFRRLLGKLPLKQADPTKFLTVINNLFNAMKHHWPHEESHNLTGKESPTIVSYYAKHNDTSDVVVFHNHNAFHVIMGYQDTMRKFVTNISKWHATK
jgi:hypothetical protein